MNASNIQLPLPAPAPSRTVVDDVHAISRIGSVPIILETVVRTTGLRFAAIARVTETSWTGCAVHDEIDFGLLPGGELAIENTFCNEIRQHRQPITFRHASEHPQFAHHLIPKMYGFESYISIPIVRKNGDFFGTLCALDPLPAHFDDSVITTLELFARMIAAELDMQERLKETTAELRSAEETGKLREQFVAVLGHDLRSPLSAIQVSADMLEDLADERTLRIVKNIQRGCGRMAEMIENILDFARGRLGSGIPVSLQDHPDLGREIRQIVAEVQQAHPGRDIQLSTLLHGSVRADSRRIAQLLANLLNNAVQHGTDGHPVRVTAVSDGAHFELSVVNMGAPIDAEKLSQLFQPFSRAAGAAPQPGLGLGLYIASEVARAHRGTLSVSSTTETGTCFVFRMPNQPS